MTKHSINRARRATSGAVSAGLAITTLLFLQPICHVLSAAAQTPQDGKRAPVCASQEQDTEHVGDWPGLHSYYARYKHCGFNADAAEGISEVIAKLVVNRWGDLGTVAHELQTEQGFMRYVLGGVNSTVDENDLNVIVQEVPKRKCPIGLATFCKSLVVRARQSKKETNN